MLQQAQIRINSSSVFFMSTEGGVKFSLSEERWLSELDQYAAKFGNTKDKCKF